MELGSNGLGDLNLIDLRTILARTEREREQIMPKLKKHFNSRHLCVNIKSSPQEVKYT